MASKPYIPPTRPAHPSAKWLAVERFILATPTAPNSEVVRACKTSPRLVSLVRAYLRDRGRVPPAFKDWTDRAYKPSGLANADDVLKAGAVDLADILAKATDAAGHEFPIEQQLAICKGLSAPGQSPQVQLAAIVTYNRIKADSSAKEQLGPGEPLTDEDKTRRLSNLMEAVGLAIAAAAFERAFKLEEPKQSGEANSEATAPGVQEPVPSGGHEASGEAAGGLSGSGGLGSHDLPT